MHAAHLLRMRLHAVAFLQARFAGRHNVGGAVGVLDFDETHAASARTVMKFRKFAERRNIDARAAGRFENGVALVEFNGQIVDDCLHRFDSRRHQSSSISLVPGMGESVATAKRR